MSWHMPVIIAVWQERQDDKEFKTSLGYGQNLPLKKELAQNNKNSQPLPSPKAMDE